MMITEADQRPIATPLIWMGMASVGKIPRYAIQYMLHHDIVLYPMLHNMLYNIVCNMVCNMLVKICNMLHNMLCQS